MVSFSDSCENRKQKNGERYFRSKKKKNIMRHNLYQFESLLNPSSHISLEADLIRLTDHLGYESLFYSPLIIGDAPAASFHDENIVAADQLASKNIFSTYPTSWIIRYQEVNFVESDPVVAAALQGNLPILWRQLPPAQSQHKVFDEARQHGLSTGISIPIHGAKGDKAVLSVSSAETPEKKIKHESAVLGQIYLAALYLHEAVQTLNFSVSMTKKVSPLSPREKECLLWASKGKTAWEIGQILHISEHTITFHLNNAKRKLGATNRHQAIASAISRKIIAP
jgi:DNA-binding CsgD family transcriptional regulator